MERDPRTERHWAFSRGQMTGIIVLSSVVLLAFAVSRMLTSSYKVTLFGHEILRVEKLDEQAHQGRAPLVIRERSASASRATGSDSDVYVVVEQMPRLVGGIESIRDKIHYPEIARRAGVEGRVFVQFVVDEEGNVTNAHVVRGIGAGCDEEALRVVEEAKFEPGHQHGEAVKVQMSLPISFRLG